MTWVMAIPWTFLAFGGAMGGMLYLHFYFAHSRWRHVRGQETEDIDPSYVRREDYFGQSFRTKLQSWLELPAVALAGRRSYDPKRRGNDPRESRAASGRSRAIR